MKIRIFFLCVLLAILFFYCGESNVSDVIQTAESVVVPIQFNSDFLKIEGNLKDFEVGFCFDRYHGLLESQHQRR